MADRYWIANTPGNWGDTANWSESSGGAGGASVPGASDAAIFNGGGLGNCTLDTNPSVLSLTLTGAYTGVFDCDSFNLTIGTGGFNCTGKTTGDILLRSGSHACDGDWTCSFDVAIEYQSSTVELTGTAKSVTFGGSSSRPNNVVISGSYSAPINNAGTGCTFVGTLTVSGSLDNQSNNSNANRIITFGSTGALAIPVGGSVSGSQLQFVQGLAPSPGSGIAQIDGILSAPILFRFSVPDPGGHLAAGTYGGDVRLETPNTSIAPVATTKAGTYVFLGDLVIASTGTQSLSLDNSGSNAAIVLHGDLSIDSLSQWTKGTGTIKLSGTADQEIDFGGESVEDLEINKPAGTAKLTGGVTTDSLTLTSGKLDFGGQSLATVGDFVAAANTEVLDSVGGGLAEVGGDFALEGLDGLPVTWSDVALAVTGTATARHAIVSGSDASGGTEIDAEGCVDEGGNTNWFFVAPPENITAPTLQINPDGTWTGTVGEWANNPTSYAWELRRAADDSVADSGSTSDAEAVLASSGLGVGNYYLWVEASNSGGSGVAESGVGRYRLPVTGPVSRTPVVSQLATPVVSSVQTPVVAVV